MYIVMIMTMANSGHSWKKFHVNVNGKICKNVQTSPNICCFRSFTQFSSNKCSLGGKRNVVIIVQFLDFVHA